ncbi:MAG: hypothetical protein IJC42_03250, partial [Oscillospiraceae bacterium]|nr:hypothetical protein [Oscillospiraceae bacterium]
ASGIGFMFALVCIAFVRELLGSGALFAAADGSGGVQILGDWYSPATIFLMPTGAFLTLGCIIALVQKIRNTAAEHSLRKQLELDAVEAGYHTEYVKDEKTGKLMLRRTLEKLTQEKAQNAKAEPVEYSDEEFIPEPADNEEKKPEDENNAETGNTEN